MTPLKALKRILPRSLFGRWLILLVTPVVLLQMVSTYVFYQRHWDTVSRRLALSVAGEIALLIETRRDFPELWQDRRLAGMADRDLQLQVEFAAGSRLDEVTVTVPSYSILDTMLLQALRERVFYPFRIDTRRPDDQIEIAVQLKDGVLRVLAQEKRLFSTTTYIFVMWMVGTSVVLLAVAILFLRNQIRPIRRLAEAADAFGKGRDEAKFHPTGAAEVRVAGHAFLAMRERLRRQISQRTEMLAGVSHDLRTPLTRMKLQLALLGDGPEIAELKRDIADMEKMIAGYLAFARGQDGEATATVDLAELLDEVVAGPRRQGRAVALETTGDLAVPVRPNALKRCLTNLVENALRHGRSVAVSAARRDGAIEIAVEDDGPGIPPERREDVFRPFTRLDASRNPSTGGVGLGLTIARDIARGHGGDVVLGDSARGGLKALVRLPV